MSDGGYAMPRITEELLDAVIKANTLYFDLKFKYIKKCDEIIEEFNP